MHAGRVGRHEGTRLSCLEVSKMVARDTACQVMDRSMHICSRLPSRVYTIIGRMMGCSRVLPALRFAQSLFRKDVQHAVDGV